MWNEWFIKSFGMLMTRVKRLVLLSNALSQRKFHSQSRACTLQHVSLSVPVDTFLWRNPPRFTVESENLANLWVLCWLTSTRPGWRIAGQCATATNVSKAGGSGNLSIFTIKLVYFIFDLPWPPQMAAGRTSVKSYGTTNFSSQLMALHLIRRWAFQLDFSTKTPLMI
jgi:hypothetical protein